MAAGSGISWNQGNRKAGVEVGDCHTPETWFCKADSGLCLERAGLLWRDASPDTRVTFEMPRIFAMNSTNALLYSPSTGGGCRGDLPAHEFVIIPTLLEERPGVIYFDR